MKPFSWLTAIWLTTTSLGAQSDSAGRPAADQLRQEETLDYFEKWLQEDVAYIITDEERAVFRRLATDEEKEAFIEQFWLRRDPDPRTAVNEFKEEHYRRIAYANERFTGGLPGWKTDRGRIYILHGPPTEIESHPTGGAYFRPLREGGGVTGVFPYEIWRYRHIEGVGEDIQLEFIDPTFSDEYRLAMRPEEKDAFLHVQGGWTMAEELGLAEKKDRPVFNPGDWAKSQYYPFMFQSIRDQPFQRYETLAMVQRAPQLKHPELKELVSVNVTFQSLPLTTRTDCFKLNDRQVLVPVSVELDAKHLSYQTGRSAVPTARLGIYGVVTALGNRVVQEFDDEATFSPSGDNSPTTVRRPLYQKLLLLDAGGRYKLDLVVKDLHSGQVGVVREALTVRSFGEEGPEFSSLVLSDHIQPWKELEGPDPMFVLGDLRVVPLLHRRFRPGSPLHVYFHLYGAGIDQGTQLPSLLPTYRLIHEGRIVSEFADTGLQSLRLFSGQRCVFAQFVPTASLEPGDYILQIQMEDRVLGRTIAAVEQFVLE
ncbi:MAG: hypothetical protein Kow001_06960 [Acidobacteriota bacterium]